MHNKNDIQSKIPDTKECNTWVNKYYEHNETRELICQSRVCYVLILSLANRFWQIMSYAPYMNDTTCKMTWHSGRHLPMYRSTGSPCAIYVTLFCIINKIYFNKILHLRPLLMLTEATVVEFMLLISASTFVSVVDSHGYDVPNTTVSQKPCIRVSI